MATRRRNNAIDNDNLGDHVRAYFDWLVGERNASRNTVLSYRDTVTIFLRYLAVSSGERLESVKIGPNMHDRVISFLHHLESDRKVSIATRNHRLSAVKGLFSFVAYSEPLLAAHCRRVTLIPFKRHEKRLLAFLEPPEMEAILGTVERMSPAGRRDYALLLMLYNTGCRASEVVGLGRADVHTDSCPHIDVLGKGRRRRTVPLWKRTVVAVEAMLDDRHDAAEGLFRGQRGETLTRAGVGYVVRKHAKLAAQAMPSIAKQKISPHTIRHTTAVALLRATGDIDAAAKILGHSSLNTTKIYTDRDRSRLAETVNKMSAAVLGNDAADWMPPDDLLGWLESL